ncbi:hypothetical protein ACLKA7_008675 [Drosophila subpalustris]
MGTDDKNMQHGGNNSSSSNNNSNSFSSTRRILACFHLFICFLVGSFDARREHGLIKVVSTHQMHSHLDNLVKLSN